MELIFFFEHIFRTLKLYRFSEVGALLLVDQLIDSTIKFFRNNFNKWFLVLSSIVGIGSYALCK